MSENGQELKQIELPISITVRDLAQTLDASPIEIIKTLMANGMMANINQQIDFDTAAIVSAEMGYEAVSAQIEEEDETEDPVKEQKKAKKREKRRLKQEKQIYFNVLKYSWTVERRFDTHITYKPLHLRADRVQHPTKLQRSI